MKIPSKVLFLTLAAENLSARRSGELIFMNIFFKLESGDMLVVTGRNGSGKSTLLRAVAGLLPPETGMIKIAGKGIDGKAPVAEACHYLGHKNAMKAELTVVENLALWKSVLESKGRDDGLGIAQAADAVGLSALTHLPFGYLSTGQQRRFAMAKLLLARRPVWLLDEPTTAIDREAGQIFAALVERHRARGGIVIAATHQPLWLDKTHELRMVDFSGLEVGT